MSSAHMRAPLVSFSLFFAAGILVQYHYDVGGFLLPVLSGIGLILAWITRSSRFLLGILWGLTFLGGMLRFGQVEARYDEIERMLTLFNGNVVTVRGKILTVSPTQRGLRYLIRSDEIADPGTTVRPRIRLHMFTGDSVQLDIGSPVQVAGRFQTLKEPRNPGEFNFRSFYHRRNIWGQIFPADSRHIRLEEPRGRIDLSGKIERIRYSLKGQFDSTVGGHPAGLLSALVVGLRKELPHEIEEDFADSGVIHVLAVSGLHVGYVLIILAALIKLFRVPYRWDKLLLVLALVGFAVLSGGKPSVWRATLMASLFVLAPLVQRDVNLWNILAASGLILLIHNPSDLFDPGFLLSYSAVISIVFLYGQFENLLPKRFQVRSQGNPLLKGAAALFIVSLAAQIGTIPFTWSFFNRIPVASVAANVLVVPLVGVLVATGFAILTVGSLLSQAGWALGNGAWGLSELTFWFTRQFSRFPLSFLEMPEPSGLNLVQYGLVMLTLLLLARKDARKRGILVGGFALNLMVWPWALQDRTLDVIFLDVGQGDAAVVRVPGGFGRAKTILVDAGRKDVFFDAGEGTVVPVMKHLGVDRVDLLIMTHPHNDHIGGVETVLEEMKVSEIWDTHSTHSSQVYESIRRKLSRLSVSYRRVQPGEWQTTFSPLHIFVLYPDSARASREKNVNNTSLVVKLLYGQTSILLLGDLESEGDREILSIGELIQSDVMKVGHHGSRTGTSDELLHAVQPKFAVVSVGERNRFDHPSEEVLLRITESGAKLWRTDRDGAVWLRSDGRKVWHHAWQ
ncbi:MAG: DNA internalization-related competence protein ComEC/Rec2 [Fidelibacterota bacterium]